MSDTLVFYDIDSKSKQIWSPNTMLTKFALDFKGISYTTQLVSYPDIAPLLRAKGVKPVPGHLTIQLTLPAIEHKGKTIMDSWKIIDYLETTFPDTPSLFPSSSKPFARSLSLYLGAADLWGITFPLLLPKVVEYLDDRGAEYFKRTREEMLNTVIDNQIYEDTAKISSIWGTARRPLKMFGSMLSDNPDGPFLLGQKFSYADVHVFARFEWWAVINLDMLHQAFSIEPAIEPWYRAYVRMLNITLPLLLTHCRAALAETAPLFASCLLPMLRQLKMLTFFDIQNKAQRIWSPNTMMTKFALDYKGIPYETEYISYPKIASTLQDRGLSLSEGAKYTLPTISDNGMLVMDSFKIAEYLEQAYPNRRPLFAHNSKPLARAVLSLCTMTSALYGSMPLLMPKIIDQLDDEGGKYFRRTREAVWGPIGHEIYDDQKRVEAIWTGLKPTLQTLETMATDIEGPFLLGSSMTYADIVLYSRLNFWEVINKPMLYRAWCIAPKLEPWYLACEKAISS